MKKHLNVKHSTLNWQLDSLQKKKLIEWEKYGPVSLTTEGKRIAEHHLRHAAILEVFLMRTLSVDQKFAHEESMTIGPLISCKLMKKIDHVLENLNHSPCCGDIPPEEVCEHEN